MFMQVFYWMQLFEETSFYVTMVLESIWDIRYFVLMVVVSISTFAIAFEILDHNQKNHNKVLFEDGEIEEEYVPIRDHKFDLNFIDSLMTQYMIGLGEFDTKDFSLNPHKQTIWIYFILATLMT